MIYNVLAMALVAQGAFAAHVDEPQPIDIGIAFKQGAGRGKLGNDGFKERMFRWCPGPEARGTLRYYEYSKAWFGGNGNWDTETKKSTRVPRTIFDFLYYWRNGTDLILLSGPTPVIADMAASGIAPNCQMYGSGWFTNPAQPQASDNEGEQGRFWQQLLRFNDVGARADFINQLKIASGSNNGYGGNFTLRSTEDHAHHQHLRHDAVHVNLRMNTNVKSPLQKKLAADLKKHRRKLLPKNGAFTKDNPPTWGTKVRWTASGRDQRIIYVVGVVEGEEAHLCRGSPNGTHLGIANFSDLTLWTQ